MVGRQQTNNTSCLINILQKIRKKLIIPEIFSIDTISIEKTNSLVCIELKLHYFKNNNRVNKLKFKTKNNKTDLEIINTLLEKINCKIEELTFKFI